VHRCLSGPRHALPLPVYVLAQARGVGWQGANLARHHCVHLILPKWGITPDALEFAGDATSPTVLLVSSWKILAVTLPEVSTLPTSATTRRASSTQRRGLINCSEQISVAQRRTAALLLHARCPDVAPKDLPSARFARPPGADGPSRPVTYYRSFLWGGPGRRDRWNSANQQLASMSLAPYPPLPASFSLK